MIGPTTPAFDLSVPDLFLPLTTGACLAFAPPAVAGAGRRHRMREGGVSMNLTMAVAGKGGIGKSFTLANLSYMMAQQGKKVLLIDLDPQGNASTSLGIPKSERSPGSYEFLLGLSTLDESVRPSQMTWTPAEFCELLAARGYRVIRFDNRDTGRSSGSLWPYAVAQMAKDAVARHLALRIAQTLT